MQVERSANAVIGRCNELRQFWSPRDEKMKVWYRLIRMVDELKTEKMESFVGNDPRAMFNLVLHMLDVDIPHRIEGIEGMSFEKQYELADFPDFFDTAWKDVEKRFRQTGPRQSLKRSMIGLLLSTGWYSCWSAIGDAGDRAYFDLWNPIQVYPMWDMELGLAEVAHTFTITGRQAKSMQRRNNWPDIGAANGEQTVHDYWWLEEETTFPFHLGVWNAIVVAGTLVKFEHTRFSRIPIFVAPVGGLPDTGPLSEGSGLSTTSHNAGAFVKGDRWKEEIGQSIVATNENIYKAWNKWWTFSLQLLRDTAQPRIFERSRSGKNIVKPEDVFRRGAIFRGGGDDAVEFLATPPMPLELRTSQIDLEAMMQRGGVSWAMYGNVTGQLTAYVMAQIAASANQVMRPYQQAIQDLFEDIDNFWLDDIRDRGVRPYNWKIPAGLPRSARVTAKFEVEIPGDLVQKATVARMLDPEFALSYSYTVQRLFPDIKNPLHERARRLSDKAELSPENYIIAQIRFYRRQAILLAKTDEDAARLYDLAADAAEAQLGPIESQPPQGRPAMGNRPEGKPQYNIPQTPAM